MTAPRIRREDIAFARLIIVRELAARPLAILLATGVLAVSAALLFEASLLTTPVLTRDMIAGMFGVESFVPPAAGVLAAWATGLRVIRRVADDAEAGWLDPFAAGGGSRALYAGAVWLGMMAAGAILYGAMAVAITLVGLLTENPGATLSLRLVSGAFTLIGDTAAYALVVALLIQRRGMGAAVAVLLVLLPFVVLMLEVAGYLPPIGLSVRRMLLVHAPMPAQSGGWGLVWYQFAHTAVLLTLAAWLAPSRVARTR